MIKIVRSVNIVMDQKVQYLLFQNHYIKIIDVNFYKQSINKFKINLYQNISKNISENIPKTNNIF